MSQSLNHCSETIPVSKQHDNAVVMFEIEIKP